MTHQYSRAERLLTRPFPTTPPKRVPKFEIPHLTNGHVGHSLHSMSHYKGKGKERDRERLPMGPGGMIEIPEDMVDGVSRLVDVSVACRYLAAQCLVRPNCAFPSVCTEHPVGEARELVRSDRNVRRSQPLPRDQSKRHVHRQF
jgi:hypothetical protein